MRAIRNSMIAPVAILCIFASCTAQEESSGGRRDAQGRNEERKIQVEVFTGYSYLRARDSLSEPLNQSGWDFSVTTNFKPSFGVVADFSNHYGTVPRVVSPIGSGGKGFTYLFGPQYSYRGLSHFTPFAHAMFGGIQGVKQASIVVVAGSGGGFALSGPCPTVICLLPETAFAMALGGGIDVKAANHFWIRLGQVEYLRANLSREKQNDVRFSTGLVFRLGGK